MTAPLFFNWINYLQLNQDLIEQGINAEEAAIAHYNKYGMKEGRNYTKVKKVVFLISHEDSHTGACNVLKNVKKFYENNDIPVVMLFLYQVYNIDIASYIKNIAQKNGCFPIVICNTLVCSSIVRKLSNSNILTYWYIHEWIDNQQPFNVFGINDTDVFNPPIIPIFISKMSCLNIKQYVPNIKNEKIIYNGLSKQFLQNKKNETPEKEVHKNDNDVIISIIGSVCPRKNQQKFINDVFYKCKDKYENVKLVLVGQIHIQLQINDEYKNSIIIVGEVKNALPYINMSDIIVSYSKNEVFPLNILESFYCGKPVISSNVGSIDEMIINNENGFLFDCDDYNSCLKYLHNLIENIDVRQKIGENGKNTFLEKYDENITFQEFLKLPEFDWKKYLELNHDLVEAGVNNEELAKYHYLYCGINENRKIFT